MGMIYRRSDPLNPSYSKMVLECSESFCSRNRLKMKEYHRYSMDHHEQWIKKRNQWNEEFFHFAFDSDSNSDFDSNHDQKSNDLPFGIMVITKSIVIPNAISFQFKKFMMKNGDFIDIINTANLPSNIWNPQIPSLWTLQRVIMEIKHEFKSKIKLFIHKVPIKMVSSFKAPIYQNTKHLKVAMKLYQNQEYLTFALYSQMENGEKCPHILGSM